MLTHIPAVCDVPLTLFFATYSFVRFLTFQRKFVFSFVCTVRTFVSFLDLDVRTFVFFKKVFLTFCFILFNRFYYLFELFLSHTNEKIRSASASSLHFCFLNYREFFVLFTFFASPSKVSLHKQKAVILTRLYCFINHNLFLVNFYISH